MVIARDLRIELDVERAVFERDRDVIPTIPVVVESLLQKPQRNAPGQKRQCAGVRHETELDRIGRLRLRGIIHAYAPRTVVVVERWLNGRRGAAHDQLIAVKYVERYRIRWRNDRPARTARTAGTDGVDADLLAQTRVDTGLIDGQCDLRGRRRP